MKRYPNYKDSGIEWIGEIPEGWDYKQIKHVAENHDSVRVPLSGEERGQMQGSYPYYGATGIIDYVDDYLFDGEYLLIGEDGAPFFIENENVAFVAKGKFWVNNHAHILKSYNDTDTGYLMYSLNTIDYKEYITGSTRDKLTQSDLSRIGIPFPPFPEQQSIANYLERKTHLIDTLIEKKQKLIGRLKEQRAASINQAVTKGLNPDVKLKDSGIEWLGEMPEGWKPVKLKFLTSKIGSGVTPRGGSEVYQETGVPLLRSQNIYSDRLRLDEVAYISQEIHDSMNSSKVQHNDVLLNITGASIGRCYYVTEELGEANVNQHVCIIRPNERIKTIFLFNVLASTIGQFQVLNSQNGTSREGLNFEELGNFIIPLPPKTEQIKVIEFLDRVSSKIFTSIDNLNNQMDHLQEYRTALISEVVTGKIDVRDYGIQEVLHS